MLSNYKALIKYELALLSWINDSEHLTNSKHCLVKSNKWKKVRVSELLLHQSHSETQSFKNHYFCAT